MHEQINKFFATYLSIAVIQESIDITAIARDGDKANIIRLVKSTSFSLQLISARKC